MNAGKTQHPVNTRVRILYVKGNDPDDNRLVGACGILTHPFGGIQTAIAGIWIDPEDQERLGVGEAANILPGDIYEIL
jgi:RimJ/RimL family protein N-acetyltransferase